jgi:nitroreductase
MNASRREADVLLRVIEARRSVREYRPDPVSDEHVRLVLAAAMAAPSASGKDPWRFVVVRSAATRAALAEALPHAPMLRNAPVGIVVCGDLEVAHDRQLSYLLQDCAAAIENLLLAATALGLGSCWLGIHPREARLRAVRDLLGLPDHVIPVSAISLGWPAEAKEPRTRFSAACVHHERWGG